MRDSGLGRFARDALETRLLMSADPIADLLRSDLIGPASVADRIEVAYTPVLQPARRG